MGRHRIIATVVNSTLYYVLWSDSRSGHFTQLRTYVLLNGSGRLRSLVCFLFCFAAASHSFPSQDTYSSSKKFILAEKHYWNKASFTLPNVEEERLVKSCFVAEFSCCVPR